MSCYSVPKSGILHSRSLACVDPEVRRSRSLHYQMYCQHGSAGRYVGTFCVISLERWGLLSGCQCHRLRDWLRYRRTTDTFTCTTSVACDTAGPQRWARCVWLLFHSSHWLWSLNWPYDNSIFDWLPAINWQFSHIGRSHTLVVYSLSPACQRGTHSLNVYVTLNTYFCFLAVYLKHFFSPCISYTVQ